MTIVDPAPSVSPAISDWVHIGFDGADVPRWRDGGWADPIEADEWRRVRGGVDPASLRELRDAGCSPDQVRRVAEMTGSQVVPWTRVLVDAEPFEPDSHHSREGTALFLLDLLATTELD